MRDSKTQIFLPGLLCAAALASFACGRGQEPAGQAAQTSQTAPAPAVPAAPAPAVTTPQPPPPPPVSELQPVPQSVQIHDETPPPAVRPQPHPQQPPAKLDSRERELAERESKIAARERRLKEREQQARAAERQPASEPAPQETGDTAPAPAPAAGEAAPEPAPVPMPPVEEPRTVEVSVPAGRVVNVELKQRLASNTSKAGDVFRVQVAHDVRVDGVVAIPRGSEIVGVVTDAVPLPRIGGQARLTLKLTDLVLPSGTTVPIHATLVQVGANQTGRDAATIGGGAVAGGILGNILSKGGGAKGSLIGALVGAVAGAAVATRAGKEELVIPEGTVLGVKLDDALAVQARVRPESARPEPD
jgi:type IV secretory pathway VirB10-like protein